MTRKRGGAYGVALLRPLTCLVEGQIYCRQTLKKFSSIFGPHNQCCVDC